MLRRAIQTSSAVRVVFLRARPQGSLPHRLHSTKVPFSKGPLQQATSEEELKAARSWLEELNEDTLPKDIGEFTFSRSSGPGGQNVNKVNSKAQLKISLDRLLPHLPPVIRPGIESSRYFAENSNSLLIQADDSRKQAQNKESCFRKLHEALQDAGKKTVRGETSQRQKERVKALQKSDNERRLRAKTMHSKKKASRQRRSD